jgi:hypothetical protein
MLALVRTKFCGPNTLEADHLAVRSMAKPVRKGAQCPGCIGSSGHRSADDGGQWPGEVWSGLGMGGHDGTTVSMVIRDNSK